MISSNLTIPHTWYYVFRPKNAVWFSNFDRKQSHVYSSRLFLNVFLIPSPLSLKWTTAPLPYIPCVHIIVSEVVLCSVLYVLWSPSLLSVVCGINYFCLPPRDLYHVTQPNLYESAGFQTTGTCNVTSFPSSRWPGNAKVYKRGWHFFKTWIVYRVFCL